MGTVRLAFIGIIIAVLLNLGQRTYAQNPNLNNAWRILVDSIPGEASGEHVKLDGLGNVFVAGSFKSGTVDFDFGAGVSPLSTGTIYEAQYFSKYTTGGNLIWARKIGGQNTVDLNAIRISAIGEVYLFGDFISYLGNEPDFDPGAPVYNLLFAGSRDGFVAKYDPNGDFIWAIRIGTASAERINGAALDVAGNFYITGYFTGIHTFAPGITLTTSNLFGDPFVAKYEGNTGTCLWAKKIGSSGVLNNNEAGQAIAIFGNSVYVVGEFAGTIDLDTGPGTLSRTSNGGLDIFVLKLDTAGVFQDGFTIGSVNLDEVEDIDVDGQGNLYLTAAQIAGSVDFDPGAGNSSLPTGPAINSVIAKYDPQLQFLWARQLDGGENRMTDLDVLDDGTVFATGYSQDTVDADGGAALYQLISPVQNGLVCSYDSAGTFRFGFQLETPNESKGIGISADTSCNMALVGSFLSTVDMAPSPGSFVLSSPYLGDCGFLGMYDWQLCGLLPEVQFPFTAELSDQQSVLLNWEISIEGNWLFAVEKSSGGRVWRVLDGLGNISGNAAEDPLPFLGLNYYRIVARDLSGQELSSEVEIIQNHEASTPSFFPNPVWDKLSISIPSVWENERIYLLDISGKVITQCITSKEIIELDVSNLSAGRYFIRFPERHLTLNFLKN